MPFNQNLQGITFSYGYGMSSFHLYGNQVFLTGLLNDTIYTVGKDGCLNPYTVYDFGLKKPGLDWSKEEIAQYIKKQQEGENVSSIYHFHLFDDFLFISFDYQRESRYVISKKDESPVFTGKFDRDKHGLCIIPVSCLSDSLHHQLVTIVEPDYLSFLLKKRKNVDSLHLIDEMQRSVNEGDNPILVFYDWKFQK
jgi:hypothetical protein